MFGELIQMKKLLCQTVAAIACLVQRTW